MDNGDLNDAVHRLSNLDISSLDGHFLDAINNFEFGLINRHFLDNLNSLDYFFSLYKGDNLLDNLSAGDNPLDYAFNGNYSVHVADYFLRFFLNHVLDSLAFHVYFLRDDLFDDFLDLDYFDYLLDYCYDFLDYLLDLHDLLDYLLDWHDLLLNQCLKSLLLQRHNLLRPGHLDNFQVLLHKADNLVNLPDRRHFSDGLKLILFDGSRDDDLLMHFGSQDELLLDQGLVFGNLKRHVNGVVVDLGFVYWDDFVTGVLDCHEMGHLDNLLYDLLDNFLNLDNLRHSPVHLQYIIDINQIQNFFPDHPDHTLVNFRLHSSLYLDPLHLFKQSFDQHSQMELHLSVLLAVIGIDILNSDDIRLILDDLDETVQLVYFDYVDYLLGAVFGKLGTDFGDQLRVFLDQSSHLGSEFENQGLCPCVLDWNLDYFADAVHVTCRAHAIRARIDDAGQ